MDLNRRRAHGLRNVVAGVLVALAVALPVTALHAQSVTNTATVTVADGVVDPVPDNNIDTAIVTVSTVPMYDFCPAGASAVFSVVNGVEIWRYDTGASADARVDALGAPVAGNLNGLMVDPVRNRLLFVQRVGASNSVIWAYDAGNGGWYQAVPSFASPDFPRAAIGPDGVGYLIAGGNNPAIWRLTADPGPGSYGYSMESFGTLTYDIAPTDPGSGDIAFDATGAAWLSAGRDLYTIDLGAPSPVAVRQVRPLLNGSPSQINWAGVAFGADGTLYVANNAATGAYHAYDPATGALTPAAPTGAGASRDLASCAFPQPAEPELSVIKTLAVVNGAPYVAGATLQPGDVLGYDITLANTGGAVATLYPGDVIETLPEHTSTVTTGNDFTCTGTSCPNTDAVNVPAGDEAVLRFVVEVVAPLPATVTAIENAVTVADVDCGAAGNDCTETTPIGPVVTVAKTSDVGDGTAVAVGQTLTYTVEVLVANAATSAPVTVTDTLGAGLDFGTVTGAGAFECSGELVCVLPAGTAPGTWAVTYTATVTADAVTSVSNTVTTDTGTCTDCGTSNPLQPAITVVKSADPAAGTTLTPGATVGYTLTVTVANAALAEPLTLTDTLGEGLAFGAVTAAGAFECGGALVCVLPAGTAPGTYAVDYSATVEADAVGTVANAVVASNPPGGDPDPVCTTCSIEHPVTLSSVTVAKTADPADGSLVLPGATINYTLTVTVADSATTEALTLTDTLGAGLSFGEVTSAGVFACTGTLTCVLPAGQLPGAYAVTYTATVDADATGAVGNSVVASNPPGGEPDPVCTTCSTEHDVTPAATSVVKTADPASGTAVLPGDTITYTLTVTVANSATTEPLTLTDTLGEGLTFGEVTSAGIFQCTGILACVLPAGQLPGAYAVTYTATVDADATGSVGNVVVAGNPPGGEPDPVCTTCSTEHDVTPAATSVVKTADPASGTAVLPGDTIAYTLTVTVANSATTESVTLTDTLGEGLTFGEVTSAGIFQCTGILACVLPAGQLPGVYALTYTAIVDVDATGSVGNAVIAGNPPGGDPDPVCTTCTTEHPIVPAAVNVAKSSNPASGTSVLPGSTIDYTLTVTVANSATTEALTLTDTLGNGLGFGEVTSAGAFQCAGNLVCVLPAGQLPGVYAVTYTAIVDADATGSVGNAVVATNPPGGDPDPVCTTCSTEHPIEAVVVVVRKDANPAPGAEVRAGDVVTYTLTAEVRNSVTTEVLTLVDTLGEGLAFGEVVDAGAFTCSGTLECTLPAGTLPGSYSLSYTALVEADASGELRNVVVASGGSVETPPECTSCSTTHTLAQPRVSIAKSSNPGSGAQVAVGDTIEYTLEALVEDAATLDAVTLVDTPDAGLAIGTLPAACSLAGDTIRCVLPAGTVPGRYTFVYPAVVTADATSSVANVVIGESDGGTAPECTSCATTHELVDEAALRITKVAGSRAARIGDLVRYTLTVENVGTLNVYDGIVLDTPPAGFTYVEDSMTVADGDGAYELGATRHPLRIGGLDIAVGQRATITYLLRVGAGVRAGVHVNTAVAVDAEGEAVSNTATAQLLIESDPMLDDSLVFGTVFDDRDGDGWQDSAKLTDLRVQGGVQAAAYVPGSTTVDRGNGPEPVADASAPLLHGIALGGLAARESVGQPARRIVVRQLLREPAFSDDFVLETAQGVRVRMAADGGTRVDTEGEAAKGLNAAAPTVERRMARVEGGIAVEYVIANDGVDERGIAGVRIATVEGLLVETDEYGRYHLADIHGGEGARGRNLVLKVDPATLPPGTAFTTDNPLLRRVTPGLPVRFDFGVRLPVREIEGGQRLLELELGEVVFAPGSAELRSEHLPVVEQIAAKVEEYAGGDLTITATAGDEALAFARAAAVRDALQPRVSDAAAAGLRIALHTDVVAAAVAGIEGGEAFLGTVLFDTDRAAIRPEFAPLLDAVARRLDAMGGGSVAVVGHTDVRGSHAYNAALGLRRAQAVYDALAGRLGPEARARLRVESSADPAAPVGGIR